MSARAGERPLPPARPAAAEATHWSARMRTRQRYEGLGPETLKARQAGATTAPSATTGAGSSATGTASVAPGTQSSRKHPTSGEKSPTRTHHKSPRPPRPTSAIPVEIKTGPGLLNVTLPAQGFVQCEPAQLGLAVSPSVPVSIVIADFHNFAQQLDITIAPPVTDGWSWPAVDFPAGTLLRMQIVASPDDTSSPDYAEYVRKDFVGLGNNVTSCLDASDLVGDGSDSSDNEAMGFMGSGGRHHDYTHNTIKAIAGVLGGVLFVLFLLVVWMTIRRRKEKRKWEEEVERRRRSSYSHNSYREMGGSEGSASAAGASAGAASGLTRRLTSPFAAVGRALISPGGSPHDGAQAGRPSADDAGMRYMARLVPSLDTSQAVGEPGGLEGRPSREQARANRRAAARRLIGDPSQTRNQDDRDDAELRDLPTYRESQREAKHNRLPKYTPSMLYEMSPLQHSEADPGLHRTASGTIVPLHTLQRHPADHDLGDALDDYAELGLDDDSPLPVTVGGGARPSFGSARTGGAGTDSAPQTPQRAAAAGASAVSASTALDRFGGDAHRRAPHEHATPSIAGGSPLFASAGAGDLGHWQSTPAASRTHLLQEDDGQR